MPRTEQGVVDAVEIWLNGNGFVEVEAIPAGARGFDIQALNSATRQRWIIEAKGGALSGADSSTTAWGRVGTAFAMTAGWRFQSDMPGDRFALAVPQSKWFDIHIGRITPALKMLGISIFQVKDDGEVLFIEHPISL